MLRVRLDAGETRVVGSGSPGVPIAAVLNDGPGVVLVEGRAVDPGSGWSPAGYPVPLAVVTALADLASKVTVR